jgi:hypothetical protein
LPPAFRKRTPAPTTVLVDEFHAGDFKGSSNYIEGGSARFISGFFELMDGRNPNTVDPLAFAGSNQASLELRDIVQM